MIWIAIAIPLAIVALISWFFNWIMSDEQRAEQEKAEREFRQRMDEEQ